MYKLILNSSAVQRLADKACIPSDPRNADWREYQEWLAAANVPEPADIPDPQIEKTALLTVARATRELILNRLGGHRDDEKDILEEAQTARAVAVTSRAVAVTANDAPAIAAQDTIIAAQDTVIAAQQAKLAAIKVCRTSLKNIMTDPRVVAAVDGEVKIAMLTAYQEIVYALYAAAPSVVVAFQGLDAL